MCPLHHRTLPCRHRTDWLFKTCFLILLQQESPEVTSLIDTGPVKIVVRLLCLSRRENTHDLVSPKTLQLQEGQCQLGAEIPPAPHLKLQGYTGWVLLEGRELKMNQDVL